MSQSKAQSKRIFHTDDFLPMLHEIHRFGAMFYREAVEIYGLEMTDEAIKCRLLLRKPLAPHIDDALYLKFNARKKIGLNSNVHPKEEVLLNSLCLRQAVMNLEKIGIECDLEVRKFSAVYVLNDREILVTARAHGYHIAPLRRMYHALIGPNEDQYDEMHMYCYLEDDEFEEYVDLARNPKTTVGRPTDPKLLKFFQLKLPTPMTRN